MCVEETSTDSSGDDNTYLTLGLIVVAVAVIVVIFLIIVAVQSPNMRIERSVIIATPPSVPFEFVSNMRKWQQWSPFEELDPAMVHTYDGPSSGVGTDQFRQERGPRQEQGEDQE